MIRSTVTSFCLQGLKYVSTDTPVNREMCSIIIHWAELRDSKQGIIPCPRSHCQKEIKEQQYSWLDTGEQKKNRPRKIFLSFNKQFSLSLTNAYTYTNLCSSAQHLWKIIKYHVQIKAQFSIYELLVFYKYRHLERIFSQVIKIWTGIKAGIILTIPFICIVFYILLITDDIYWALSKCRHFTCKFL